MTSGWDPRGIGYTVPRADCFKTGTEENAFWEGTIPRAGLEARGNFTEQSNLDEFYEQVDEVDELLEELGQKCVAYSPDTFQYIGTAAGVRDMVYMHDLLEGKDKPVDYWGLSYGTVIGIYFVNSEFMLSNALSRVLISSSQCSRIALVVLCSMVLSILNTGQTDLPMRWGTDLCNGNARADAL